MITNEFFFVRDSKFDIARSVQMLLTHTKYS